MKNITAIENKALSITSLATVPDIIQQAGEKASYRFVEFFTAQIRNPNTRRAYHTNVTQFFHWCDSNQLDLQAIHSIHVASYIEKLQHSLSAPTVKQHLAAIRMLFNWLTTGHIIETNPATPVRGPKYSAKRGKTPILSAEDTRLFLDGISIETEIGLRDRALVAMMVFSFARITAVLKMKVSDYYPNGKRWWIRLHEKGGKYHEMPAHHTLEDYLDEYLTVTGLRDDPNGYLFRSFGGRGRQMTENSMLQTYAWQMIRRRAKDVGIYTPIGNHSFRGTGITTYLKNGGTLEKAQQMAAHESPRTTKLYDRSNDEISLDEVEKIII